MQQIIFNCFFVLSKNINWSMLISIIHGIIEELQINYRIEGG